MTTIGPYRIRLIETGDFKLDGGAMFGVVPKPLWERSNPADELNRIEMTARCLLIESDDRKILVDAGIGHKEADKFNSIFVVDYSRNTLEASLEKQGVSPDEITDFIYTHLHFDHAGGSTRLENDVVVPVFSKARHYVQRRQYEHALSRCERDRASYIDHNYVPLHEAGMLEFIDGDTELFPGIHLLTTSGHTPDLQTILVTDGKESLWYPTDLVPLVSHIPFPYIMGYDLQPLVTLADKQKYLPRACDENWTAVFEHDAHCIACKIDRNEKGRLVRGKDVEI